MGFIQKIGNAADKLAMSMVNATAVGAPSHSGSVDGVASNVPLSSKGQREPPPRVSKMTWQETLDAQKAAKAKEDDLVKGL